MFSCTQRSHLCDEKADKLAKEGATAYKFTKRVCTIPPLVHLCTQVKESWQKRPSCRISQHKVIGLPRIDCRKLVGIMTGHCLLRELANQIGLLTLKWCRHCNVETEVVIYAIRLLFQGCSTEH